MSRSAATGKNVLLLMIFGLASLFVATASAQESSSNGKSFDVHSSMGNAHLGNDADARSTGLPAYPGARLRKDEQNGSNANLDIITSVFGFKLAVAKYDSGDAQEKIVVFYRDKMKKYGNVLECHTSEHGGHVNVKNDDHDSGKSKPVTCDDDKNDFGNVIELKVGTEDNQHIVAVEPAESGVGSTIALVYVYTRGKQGDI